MPEDVCLVEFIWGPVRGKTPCFARRLFPIEAAYAASTNPSSSLLRHTFLQKIGVRALYAIYGVPNYLQNFLPLSFLLISFENISLYIQKKSSNCQHSSLQVLKGGFRLSFII